MAILAIVVPVDLGEPIRRHELDTEDVGAYRRLVGGLIQAVELARPASTLYCNEKGKLLSLPHNRALRGRDVIAGPAFIVGPPDGHGRDTSVPGSLVELLPHTRRYRVEVQVAGDDQWYSNGLVFDDWPSAYAYGSDLAQRWTAVRHVRIVAADTPSSARSANPIGKAGPYLEYCQVRSRLLQTGPLHRESRGAGKPS